jgi:uncharacterized protein (TIGR02996 family)
MAVLESLLDAIDADPGDLATQLVLADALTAAGDPRGELIVLSHREPELDATGRESLLLIAAEYGFPLAHASDESILPYRYGCQGYPVEVFFDHGGYTFYVRYRHDSLSITEQDERVVTGVEYPGGFDEDFEYLDHGTWTDEEAEQTLAVISDAIRYNTPFDTLWFPAMRGTPPRYPDASRRIYRLPADYTEARGISRDRYGLAARDHARWLALWARHQAES